MSNPFKKIVDNAKEIEGMHEEGLLDDEEFKTKKEELLKQF